MLAAVSVDLDEVHLYAGLHGLGVVEPRHAVYDAAIPRLLAWADELAIPLTFFAVASDLDRAENGAVLRSAIERGHRVESHSLSHRYDLVRLDRAAMTREVGEARARLGDALGVAPEGFRAPGYTIDERLRDAIVEAGHAWDSSVFPSAPYQLAKLAALGLIALRGRTSRAIVGSPRVLVAPKNPYRWGGLVEIPIQTATLGLPFIGTSLTVAPAPIRELLVRSVRSSPVVNLELHGLDALDDRDVPALRSVQPDLRISREKKLDRLARVVRGLGDRRFVTVGDLARTVG